MLSLPIILVFYRNQSKAVALGLLDRPATDRTILQAIRYYSVEYDGEVKISYTYLLLLSVDDNVLTVFSHLSTLIVGV